MKHLKLLIVMVIYIFLVTCFPGCKDSHESDIHDHDHEQLEQVHTNHSDDEENDNEDLDHEESDHDQDSEVEEHADEDHDDDEEGHDHGEVEGRNSQTTPIVSGGEEWEKLIGLETAEALLMPLELTISVPGQIVPNQNRVAVVSPFIESSINEVFVNLGDKVESKELLACLTSPEIGMLRADYDKAKAELDITKQNFERQQKLFDEKIIPRKSYQEAKLEHKVAEVQYNYALKKLLAIGISNEEIDNPPTGHSDAVGSTIHIFSPISGVVTSRNARTGQKVDSSSQLFEIMNLENVWLEADIFEKDLTKIRPGQTVKVKVSAYPDDVFTGEIFYIGSTLNPETKTIKILVEIDNTPEKLKPGMFAETNIVIGEKLSTLVVPKEAVLEDENLKIVFVREEEGYHRQVVTTGVESVEMIEILSGLTQGSTIVIRGNYQLKSKLKNNALDPHAAHSH